MSNETLMVIAIVVAAIVVVLAVWMLFSRRKTAALRARFGPEYDHAVHEFGNQAKAEDALAARQRRIANVQIRSLSTEERNRFAAQWHEAQARFVDDPPASIQEADRLVNEVMNARGYPMAEFEGRAEDISVDHPHVVRNYRAAHEIALLRDRGEASTEDLRKALVYYRDLFDELLEAHVAAGPRGARQ